MAYNNGAFEGELCILEACWSRQAERRSYGDFQSAEEKAESGRNG